MPVLIDEKCGVEKVGCICMKLRVVAVENYRDVIGLREFADDVVNAIKHRHGGFRPHEQIRAVGDGALRACEQFGKALFIFGWRPD